MKNKVYMLFLLIITIANYGQNLIPAGEIGSFNSAGSFSINPYGIIFVSDDLKNEITKLDTLGNVIKTIGGYGWDNSSFDCPIDVFSNVLNVFVADKNNNRIQLFDKDLNFLSQLSTQESGDERFSFRYPTSVATSNQGDFYVLDSDNQRILKFNLRGEFISEFGGIEAGEFRMTNPVKFCLDDNFNLLAIEGNSLFVFDQFGNGKKKLSLPVTAKNINSLFSWITLVDAKSVVVFESNNDFTAPLKSIKLDLAEEIVDACVFKSKLYVLTSSAIFIYQMQQE
ncbi:MAG: NHL repeat-containing protein [Ignavibacteriales bacterium]|nr:NHL repeat-containing protein [Ignavibacteriales bacterium]